MTQGGRFSGLGLYLLEGKPVFHYNLAGVARYAVAAEDKVPPGHHVITVDFNNYDGGGVDESGRRRSPSTARRSPAAAWTDHSLPNVAR
ncbi:MAG: hypothetical protein R3D01_02675 [Hyphomicrobiales bacterium]